MCDSILIVDDNPENLAILGKLLGAAGYEVHPASDGKMALKALRYMHASLILLDIRMPDMDGYQVCQELKKDPATRDIPVIFISALHESLDKVKAFTVGGVDYVCKPFDQAEVLARVATHLTLHRLQKLQRDYNEELELAVSGKTAALREANAGLEKALQAKDDFLTLLNHELRTPLNGILGMAYILKTCPGEDRDNLFNMLEESGQHLLKLIENLLQLTEQGCVPPPPGEPPVSIDIRQVCTESLNTVTRLAKERNITVNTEIHSPAKLEMPLGLARIRMILINLLDNAVKFTPPGGRAGLKVYYNDAEHLLYLDVWDTGPGISEAEQKRVFQPFVQLQPVLTRSHEGLGIGLTLVHNLVRLHRGQIQIAPHPGGGSVVRVSLPAKPVPQHQ